MKTFIIVGSIREGRTAIKVADWIQQFVQNLATPKLDIEIVDLKLWDLPLFSGAHPPASGIYDQPKQQQWADKISQANSFIIISPEYNHGYSPALKNALDYLGKEWKAKPVLYISYGATTGSRSIDQIRQVGHTLGLIDLNLVIQIRDIFSRNQEAQFVANEYEERSLHQAVLKMDDYISKQA